MPNDLPTAIERWIYTTLVASAPLVALVGNNVETGQPNIYWALAALRGATYPLVIFQSQLNGGFNLLGIGNEKVWLNDLYQVRAVGRADAVSGVEMTDLPAVRQAAYYIDQSLHQASGSNADGRVLICRQEDPLVFPPTEVDGVLFYSRGGIYRILAQ